MFKLYKRVIEFADRNKLIPNLYDNESREVLRSKFNEKILTQTQRILHHYIHRPHCDIGKYIGSIFVWIVIKNKALYPTSTSGLETAIIHNMFDIGEVKSDFLTVYNSLLESVSLSSFENCDITIVRTLLEMIEAFNDISYSNCSLSYCIDRYIDFYEEYLENSKRVIFL